MSKSVSTPRNVRHSGATGKTLLAPLSVGEVACLGGKPAGEVIQVRRKRTYANRYRVRLEGDQGFRPNSWGTGWFRHDQIRCF